MKPLVSIIIPSYNHALYITEALDSVKADSYPNKEIVVIDDGSRDESVKVIEKWMAQNPSINVKFRSRENRGLCRTLNELVEATEGKYLVILASDDYLVNNTISERVAILEDHPEKLVLVSDAEVVDDKGEKIFDSSMEGFHKKKKKNYLTDEGILDEVLFNFGISGAVVLLDKSIYKEIGLYPENLHGEDLYFYSKAALNNKILFYDKVVSGYRIHDTNTSANKNPDLLKNVMDVYLMIFKNVPGVKRKLRIIKNIAWIIKYITLDQNMRKHFQLKYFGFRKAK